MSTSDVNNKQLIQLVKERPALYNSTLPEYSNTKYTDMLWEEVALIMHCPVKPCKQKWINIRNSYSRHLRNMKRNSHCKKYYLADLLSFLQPFIADYRRRNDKKLTYPESYLQMNRINDPLHTKIKEELNDEEQENVMLVLEDYNSDNENENDVTLKTSTKNSSVLYDKQSSESSDIPYQSIMVEATTSSIRSNEQEHSFIDFAKSLVIDYSQLSMRRQRIFKQKVLMVLNDLLDEQEAEIN